MKRPERIVVGVDGSKESQAALRWALEEARLRGASLTALHAWTYPVVPGRGIAPAALVIPPDVVRREAEELLESAVSEAFEGAPEPLVRRVAIEGSPAESLVEASKDADLLVVGSRGRGGLSGVLLGSVSRQCAHDAWCPVVIVRPGRRAARSHDRKG
jgi:nucleotide-binding universal stress UspA family protein